MPPTDPAPIPAAALAAIEAAVAQHRTMAAAHDRTPIVLQLHTVERLLAELRRQQARAERYRAALERIARRHTLAETSGRPSALAVAPALMAGDAYQALAADGEPS